MRTGNKIIWKRGEIAPTEQFLLFFTIFSEDLYFQESNYIFICEMWLFDLSFFLNSAYLICQDTDISSYLCTKNIVKKRRNCLEQFLLFFTIFSVYFYFQESNYIFICEMWLFDLSFFLNSAYLICQDTDIFSYLYTKNIVKKRRTPLFHNIFSISLFSEVKLHIHLWNVVVWFIFFPQFCKSDMLRYGYLEVFQRVPWTSR